MRDRIVRLSVALQRCDADEAAELPAGVEPTPCAPWAASSIDGLADASYNESKCAMRNLQLLRKPAPHNEMEEPQPFAEGQPVHLYWPVDGQRAAPPFIPLNPLATDLSPWLPP